MCLLRVGRIRCPRFHVLPANNGVLAGPGIDAIVRQVHAELSASLEAPSDAWRAEIPGKLVISRFAPAAKMELARFKTLYLATAERTGSHVFDDIIDIFRSFSSV